MSSVRSKLAQGAVASLAVAAAALLAAPAEAATYLESSYSGGDFSNDSATPTQLLNGALPLGDNIVTGTTGQGDNDYFTFTIAPHEQLKAITLEASSTPPDRTFIGIASGPSAPPISSFMSGGNFTTAAGLLGWYLIDADLDGHDILPDLGAADPPDFPTFKGATGFIGALPAGTYTMWVLDGDGPAGAPYSLDFKVSSAPEPAGWALMLVGVGAIGGAMRRRPERRSAAA